MGRVYRKIRGKLEAKGIWWHSQNLNEDSHGNVVGSQLRKGRAWLHLLGESNCFGLEWPIFKKTGFHLGLDLGCMEYVMISPAKSVSEAVAELVTDVLKTRERYGGKNWKPEMRSKG